MLYKRFASALAIYYYTDRARPNIKIKKEKEHVEINIHNIIRRTRSLVNYESQNPMNIFSALIEKQDADKLSRHIEQLAVCLVNPTNAVPLTRASSFPDKPGVYCIFEHQVLIYVGETGSLKERMKDIFRTMNHSFRRSLGKHQFANVAGVSEANSKTNFPFDVELRLTEYMESNIQVALTPVTIGRKEVEEVIIKKHTPIFNSRGQRGQL